MNNIGFEDRVVIVTGAGRGLGRHYALDLARRGASVVVNDAGGDLSGEGSDSGPAQAVVREILEAGGSAVASTDSVSEPEGGRAIVDMATQTFGRLDAVVNNAGILRDRTFAKVTPEETGAVLAVHVRGAFNVTVPAYRLMREQGYGRIVMTTSAAGLFGNFGQASYSAAKMALVGLSSTIAIEGRSHGILCNAVAPMAKSRMTADIMGDAGGLVDPRQVVPLVTFLCSSECTKTQQVFSAGGGRFARVFMGVGPGWFAGTGAVTAEQIVENLDQILASDPYALPVDAGDESRLLLPHLDGLDALGATPVDSLDG